MSVVDPIAPPSGPNSTGSPGPGRSSRPPRPRLLDLTAVVAALGVVIALAGVGVLALPVRTPLQDCGSSFTFLYDGRTNTLGDPDHPPKGITKAQVLATNAKPCRPRVADRAITAAELILGGLALAIVTVLVEVVIRQVVRRR